MTVVQVHPDVESMELHMKLAQEHIGTAYQEYLEGTTSIHVYGTLSDAAAEMMRRIAGSGVPLSVTPNEIGGFTRSAAE